MSDLIVAVQNVYKSYRRGPEEVHALEDVNLELVAGEVTALVGPSGSGKTTLLNILAGWEKPDRGDLVWPHAPRVKNPGRLRWSDLAILPQTTGLIEELSVRENIALPGRLRGRNTTERIDSLLEGLGLAAFADRVPAEISIGEQQRTGLARALVLGPKLLLADEPAGHQDADWAAGVFATIRRAAAEGTSCLVATHNQELLGYADGIVGIRDGRLEPVRHTDARPAPNPQPVRAVPEVTARRATPHRPRRDERGVWGPP
jgi:putative ABC transport system ATP-binding protein